MHGIQNVENRELEPLEAGLPDAVATIGQGSLSALRTSWIMVGGSVAGCASVWLGIGVRVLRSTIAR